MHIPVHTRIEIVLHFRSGNSGEPEIFEAIDILLLHFRASDFTLRKCDRAYYIHSRSAAENTAGRQHDHSVASEISDFEAIAFHAVDNKIW